MSAAPRIIVLEMTLPRVQFRRLQMQSHKMLACSKDKLPGTSESTRTRRSCSPCHIKQNIDQAAHGVGASHQMLSAKLGPPLRIFVRRTWQRGCWQDFQLATGLGWHLLFDFSLVTRVKRGHLANDCGFSGLICVLAAANFEITCQLWKTGM